jgi:hypothetical protein
MAASSVGAAREDRGRELSARPKQDEHVGAVVKEQLEDRGLRGWPPCDANPWVTIAASFSFEQRPRHSAVVRLPQEFSSRRRSRFFRISISKTRVIRLFV